MRKTVTVSVQIQMDVETRKDTLPQVQDVLELMNKVVDNYGIDASPQIFISDISDSDIIENEDEEIKMCQKYQDSEIFISDISDSDIIENEDEEIKMCQKYQDSEALPELWRSIL